MGRPPKGGEYGYLRFSRAARFAARSLAASQCARTTSTAEIVGQFNKLTWFARRRGPQGAIDMPQQSNTAPKGRLAVRCIEARYARGSPRELTVTVGPG